MMVRVRPYYRKFKMTITRLTHVIRSIRGKKHGLTKGDTCRLVQALLLSRMTYADPFIDLKPQEISKLDALIRKRTKRP